MIDGKDGYLIPGLIDGHVHLDVLPVLRPEDEAKHPGLAEALCDPSRRAVSDGAAKNEKGPVITGPFHVVV